tara:strand:+ start:519 stop:1568 length:1050 start_codon:yes stop_codon:yes gene_type:complete
MANANIQRLLTDFGRQNQTNQGGSTFGSRMAAAGGQFGQGMMTGLGRAGAQSGIKAFENMDMRPAADKLAERLTKIDRTTPEGQAELVQIVSATKGTDAGIALQSQFAKEATAKQARDEAIERDRRDAALAQAREDRLKAQNQYQKDRDTSQDEIAATDKVLARDRQLSTDQRSERSTRVSEESLALRQAQTDKALTKEEKDQADNAVLRALYIRQANDNGNDSLAEALKSEAFPLDKASGLLYGSSRAQMTAPSEDEAAAMEAIIMSPAMDLDIAGLPRKFWGDNLKPNIKRAIFYKAKELRLRNTKLSIEDALRDATISVKELQGVPDKPELVPASTTPDPQAGIQL